MKRCLALASAVLLAVCPAAPAALPPSYDWFPERAPEIADIRVLAASWLPRPLRSNLNMVTWRVVALAVVTDVHKTGSNLKAGSVITIAYDSQIPRFGVCGAFRCHPLLIMGQNCRMHMTVESAWPRVFGPFGPHAFGAVRAEKPEEPPGTSE